MDKIIGAVVHYFDRAQVIVVKLTDAVKVGDQIKVKRGEEEFTLTIDSMQIEHAGITEAKAGDEVAIKVAQPTKSGAAVYKIE
jgi:ribosomal 50S subunit-recycling heat shock protein